jgi:hypothetical protein
MQLTTFHVELGNLAECLAAVGTVARFAATWVVISRDHKSRREQQATSAYDAALVFADLSLASGPHFGNQGGTRSES